MSRPFIKLGFWAATVLITAFASQLLDDHGRRFLAVFAAAVGCNLTGMIWWSFLTDPKLKRLLATIFSKPEAA